MLEMAYFSSVGHLHNGGWSLSIHMHIRIIRNLEVVAGMLPHSCILINCILGGA